MNITPKSLIYNEFIGFYRTALDGVMVIALGVMVVGLMAALPMALRHDPVTVAFWMALAFGVNFGAQILTHRVVRSRFAQSEAVPVSIVSGNRNVAIFLVALAPSVSEPLLIFLGCYQVPMYLTPIMLRWLYRPAKTTPSPP